MHLEIVTRKALAHDNSVVILILPFPPPLPPFLEQPSPANECLGMDYLLQAAERGMKLAMLEAAKAYDSGVGLGKVPEGDATFPAKQRLAKINVHV